MSKTRHPLTVHLVLAAAAVTAVFAPLSRAHAEYANPDGVAVIIGNRTYGGDIPAVDFAHRDAEAFRGYVLDVLGFDPENIIDLRDTTQAEMWSTFGSRTTADRSELWSYLADEGSDVVVFYSGHGVPGIDDERGYLLPVNADPNTAELNGYPIDVLFENLANLKLARSIAVYLDACFSGGSAGAGMLIEGASPVYVEASLPEAADDRLSVLTAASGKQLASWDRKVRHGLFTHHLLEALYGKADRDADGRVTAREAKAYLDRYMTRAAKRTWKRRQKASFLGDPDAVLARAGVGGTFPLRPELEINGTAPAGAGEEKAVATADPVTPVETPESAEAALGLTYDERVLVQHGLASLGVDLGRADGVFGRRTRAGIRGYQKQKGLRETGHLNPELRDALVALGEAHAQERRRAERERQVEMHRAASERRADDEAFAEAKRIDTLASYRDYLDRGGRHEAEARERLAAVAKPKRDVGEKFRDCAECPEMVVVPSGSYEMGSPSSEKGRERNEGPVHRVTISESFAMGVYEVTRGEWGRFVAETGYAGGDSCWVYQGGWNERRGRSWRDPGFDQGEVHPVACVSWDDVQAYLAWLTSKTAARYRLPSESEWEFATRGGTTTARYWGHGAERQCYHGNGIDSSSKRVNPWGVATCDDGHAYTSPVGSFTANAFGLHDVLGNVREWVQDCWHESYGAAPADGSAWTSGGDCARRVLRGGSWFGTPNNLRSARRINYPSGFRHEFAGFRVARTLD